MGMLKTNVMNHNVSETERWASLIGGGTLLAFGLGKRTTAGWALAALGGSLLYRGASGYCAMYEALGINTAENPRNTSVPYELGIRVDQAITINKSPEEVYQFWRNFENLPRFMDHLESVTVKDSRRSHWVAKAPMGTSVEWDAEIVNEIENKLIGWRSLEGSDVDNAGSVHFDPGPNGGCIVRVELQYNPPAGYLGGLVARLFGEEPSKQIADDLRRLKQLMETGQITTTMGQSSGRKSGNSGELKRRTFDRDLVTQSSEESFPASDPPSWTPAGI